MVSPVVVVAALAERRSFSLSSACPVGAVETSFPPSNNRMEHNAAGRFQLGGAFRFHALWLFAPRGSCGAFRRRAVRLGFLMPLRRIRDISAERSFAAIPDQRDFAARFCCTSISCPQFGHFIVAPIWSGLRAGLRQCCPSRSQSIPARQPCS